ncbi:hypothetical protein JCM4914_70450 [Streptomyces platensis subsp. malvinus]
MRSGLRTTVPPQKRPVWVPSVQKKVPTCGRPSNGWLGGTGSASADVCAARRLLFRLARPRVPAVTGSAAAMRCGVQYTSSSDAEADADVAAVGWEAPAAWARGAKGAGGTISNSPVSPRRRVVRRRGRRPRTAIGLGMIGVLPGMLAER